MKTRKNRSKWIARCLVIVMLVTCLPVYQGREVKAAIASLYWPVRNASGACVNSFSSHNTWNGGSGHKGIDIANAAGCSWYAAYSGVIDKIYTGCNSNGYNTAGHTGCSPNRGRYGMTATIGGRR